MAKKEVKDVVPVYATAPGNFFQSYSLEVIQEKTPANELEKLPGKDFDYVRVGYMRGQMEKAFPQSWDVEFFETSNAETLLKAKAIVVKARISIRHPQTRQVVMVKEAYGGVGIKFLKDGSGPLDLGNDYKSAQADAMKKAISLFGICADVYEPVVHKREEAREDRDEEAKKEAFEETRLLSAATNAATVGITAEVWKVLVARAARVNVTGAMVLDYINTTLKKDKPSKVIGSEVNGILEFIETFGVR